MFWESFRGVKMYSEQKIFFDQDPQNISLKKSEKMTLKILLGSHQF